MNPATVPRVSGNCGGCKMGDGRDAAIIPKWKRHLARMLVGASFLCALGTLAALAVIDYADVAKRAGGHRPEQSVASMAALRNDWEVAEFIYDSGTSTGFGGRRNIPGFVIRLPKSARQRPEELQSGLQVYSRLSTDTGCIVDIVRNPRGAGGTLWAPRLRMPTTPVASDPCHGSVFDLARGGEVIFGPAPRPLDRFTFEVRGDKVVITGFVKSKDPEVSLRNHSHAR